MFQIKICGITTVEDAQEAVAAGADAVGLNFYPGSPRCVDRDTAQKIVQTLPGSVAKVGVFVNAGIDTVKELADHLPLDFVQLSGDEPPDYWQRLHSLRLIPVLRGGVDALESIRRWLFPAGHDQPDISALLIDAWEPGAFGGTGKVVDWGNARELVDLAGGVPVVLAGGLRPDNVRRAIEVARPAAVDVASGVEQRPGKKDADKVRAFVRAAREGFDMLLLGDL